MFRGEKERPVRREVRARMEWWPTEIPESCSRGEPDKPMRDRLDAYTAFYLIKTRLRHWLSQGGRLTIVRISTTWSARTFGQVR